MSEVLLTTTQEYGDSANFIAGSLNGLTITLKNTSHKYWEGELTSHASTSIMKKGTTYTVANVISANDDWSTIGKDFMRNGEKIDGTAVEVGDTFIADDNGGSGAEGSDVAFTVAIAGADAKVSYGNNQQALARIIRYVQTRTTIAHVGVANNSSVGAGLTKVRLLVENSGDENYSRENNSDLPTGYDSQEPVGSATQMLRALNEIDGLAPAADDIWAVEDFVL